VIHGVVKGTPKGERAPFLNIRLKKKKKKIAGSGHSEHDSLAVELLDLDQDLIEVLERMSDEVHHMMYQSTHIHETQYSFPLSTQNH